MHAELQASLLKRTEIISDRSWYERDPDGHLEALKNVSGEIDSYFSEHRSGCDAQLAHFLKNASYQKALDHLQKA
ncbi:hypothetical protein [Luteolibacter sp. AS25]|uniref:hypothetical protein n=1 Tax=Luteolibacter sp. AS25 TaxID=3135776 RepID=UPI00398AC00C